jgi:2-polyprenyl-6-methoxyphenol hydroxylase-like FAD-dependent oxidoreductase
MSSGGDDDNGCHKAGVDDTILQNEHIWVLGGGLAGLATAAALRAISGCAHVTVLECMSEAEFYDDKAGAVAKVGPNGLRALQAIDEQLVEKITREGHILKALAMYQAGSATGEVTIIPDCTLKDTGLPQTLIRWGVLRKMLQELLPRESIVTGIGAGICGYEVVTGEDGQQQHVRLINEQGEAIGPKDLPLPSLIVAAGKVRHSLCLL